MSVDRLLIRVKAMVVAPNDALTAHAVTLNPPTKENPDGYHRLIGGGVEFGERHQDAIVREVDEELGAPRGRVRVLRPAGAPACCDERPLDGERRDDSAGRLALFRRRLRVVAPVPGRSHPLGPLAAAVLLTGLNTVSPRMSP